MSFVEEAHKALAELRDEIGGPHTLVADRHTLREGLLEFVAQFANWNHATEPRFIRTARLLTRAAGDVLGSVDGVPVVLDPFAGGGAIPLEAGRCGAAVLAGDLNPIAVLQNRVVTELAPKITFELTQEFESLGSKIKARASTLLSTAAPGLVGTAAPFAWFVARTISCEGPACGVTVPLIRGFMLSSKKKASMDWVVDAQGRATTDIDPVTGSTRPVLRIAIEKVNSKPSASGGGALCPVCGYTTKQSRVALQASERGFGYRLTALGVFEGDEKKTYRTPSPDEERVFAAAEQAPEDEILARALDVPINALRPSSAARGMSAVTRYGYHKYSQLFGGRQRAIITAFQTAVSEAIRDRAKGVNDDSELMSILLMFAIDRLSTFQNKFCRWQRVGEHPVPPFGKNGFPMVWDFALANPFSDAAGSWDGGIHWIALVLRHLVQSQLNGGLVQRVPAQVQWMPDDSVDALITDPPYYDSYPYADLSDFFFPLLAAGFERNGGLSDAIWRVGDLSPKDAELVVQPTRKVAGVAKDSAFYEHGLRDAFESARRAVKPAGVGVVVFANKTTEGWEAVLAALLDAGWVVTASWPIQTERESRTRGEARLQSSVHIVCRPRELANSALGKESVGDWREVLAALPVRIHEWMPRLSADGIVGADAIFACLGPALEIFSRFSRVEKMSGEAVPLREYLEHVWAAVSREALTMVFRDADTSGLEEDARLSAMWLWTLAGPVLPEVLPPPSDGNGSEVEIEDDDDEDIDDDDSSGSPSKKGLVSFALEYDAARKIAQGLGVRLDDLGHIAEVKKGKARLLTVAERAGYLFGKVDSPIPKKSKKKQQVILFDEIEEAAEAQGWNEVGAPRAGTTTLDRVHQAMLLFASGRGEALRRFLVEEGAGAQLQFWRLGEALSYLYPVSADEKRWVDGLLARKKGLGF